MGDLIMRDGTHNMYQIHSESRRRRLSPRSPSSQQASAPGTPSPASASETLKCAVRTITDVRYHLEICTQTLRELEAAGESALAEGQPTTMGVSPVTIRTVAACLSELLKLEWMQPHRDSCHDLCKLLDCPQQPVLREAILNTIDVLETTKFRFKSKELKRLREGLETLLGNSQDYSPAQES